MNGPAVSNIVQHLFLGHIQIVFALTVNFQQRVGKEFQFSFSPGWRGEVRPHDGEIAARDANRRFLKQEINKSDGSHRGENRTPALGGAIATVVRGVQFQSRPC